MASFDKKQFWLSLGVCGLIVMVLATVELARGRDLLGLSMPVCLCGGSALGAWKRHLPTSEAHAALPTLTEEHDALPVLLTVQDERGQTTGRDHGWVAFADGWLVYEGLRTEFTLTKAAVDHPEYLPNEIALRTFDGRRLTLSPIAAGGTPSVKPVYGDGRLLGMRVRAWRSETIPEELSTLPPRTLHPEVARERLTLPPVYAFSALFLATISNAFFGSALAWTLIAVAVCCAVWSVVGLVLFARRLPTIMR